MGDSDFPTSLGIIIASAILGGILAIGLIVGMLLLGIFSA